MASELLRHFRLFLWKPLNGLQRNLTGSTILTASTKFVLFGQIGKTKWPPWVPDLWLAETFSTSPLKPLNGIQWNLTGNKISTSATKLVFIMVGPIKNKMGDSAWSVFFGPIGKPKWLTWLQMAGAFPTSLQLLNGIQRNLAEGKYSTSSGYSFLFWVNHHRVFHSNKGYSGARLWLFGPLILYTSTWW